MSHPYHGLNELREMFLSFFESKGHLRLPSFSLVPQNDKSILLINAGIDEIVYQNPYPDELAMSMLEEAGMKLRVFDL